MGALANIGAAIRAALNSFKMVLQSSTKMVFDGVRYVKKQVQEFVQVAVEAPVEVAKLGVAGIAATAGILQSLSPARQAAQKKTQAEQNAAARAQRVLSQHKPAGEQNAGEQNAGEQNALSAEQQAQMSPVTALRRYAADRATGRDPSSDVVSRVPGLLRGYIDDLTQEQLDTFRKLDRVEHKSLIDAPLRWHPAAESGLVDVFESVSRRAVAGAVRGTRDYADATFAPAPVPVPKPKPSPSRELVPANDEYVSPSFRM